MTTVMPWYWLFALLSITAAKEQTRWSRQISSYTSDLGDWVPLPGPMLEPDTLQSPVKRQAVAQPRILAEPFPGFNRPPFSQDSFPSRLYQTPLNRQLYLSSVPSAPQNYLSEQGFGQNVRFGLTQPNFPLAQGFVSQTIGFDNPAPQFSPQIHIQHKQRVPISNPVNFPKPHGHEHFVSNQAKPFNMPQPQQRPATNPPKFVDGYKLENNSFTFQSNKKKPQPMQKVKFESKIPETMVNKPKSEREEVQLLYVPMDTLNRGQYSFKAPVPNMGDPNVYSALQQKTAQQSYVPEFQRQSSSPVEKFSFGQDFYQNYNTNSYNPYNPNPNPLNLKEYDQVPKFSTLSTPPFATAAPTTPAPKKLKPHQPPLAIFLAQEARKGDKIKVGDVLLSLKNAHTISVLDAVNPNNSPKVFIGPSNLAAPEKYVKFELPYLSNIENSDKKLRQMPFFVAPLSYNTPDGFAKIPFPSPHVGSVIVNSQIRDTNVNRPLAAEITPNAYTAAVPAYKEQKAPAQKPTFSYYSTAAPKTNPPPAKQNFYSFEQQQVNALKNKEKETPIMTAPPTKNLYFISKDSQYNQNLKFIGKPEDYPENIGVDVRKPDDIYEEQYRPTAKPTSTRTPTKYTTTQQASTYPSQLLETHNPYSINQAFHLSTPLDFNHYIEDGKDGFATPPSKKTTQAEVTKPKEIVTEKPKFAIQQQQNYLHNYNPEIQFESDLQNSRYPQNYDNNQGPPTREQHVQSYEGNQGPPTREQQAQIYESYNDLPTRQPQNNLINRDINQSSNEYSSAVETQGPKETNTEGHVEASYAPQESNEQHDVNNNNQYGNNAVEYSKEPVEETTTTTSTTTTRRSVVRPRGRPRYTTQKPNLDNNEGTTRSTVRRPLRERKPMPARPKYEPNRITTEKPERPERAERPSRRPQVDNSDATTRATRSRTRGKVQFKPSDETFKGLDENNDGKQKQSTKDLAYQRDVLHQNYPVTLMERMSTVDIEAITEPLPRISSTRNAESVTIAYDTENAYSNEYSLASVGDKVETFTNRPDIETTAYVPRVSNPEYSFHQRSSPASEINPTNAIPLTNKDENIYYFRSSSAATRVPEVSTTTESVPVTNPENRYSPREDHSQVYNKEEVTTPEAINEVSRNTETVSPAEEAPQTTPAYNRVRVRPGGLRPYAQRSTSAPVSTTKAPRTEERKRPQAVTYRPAYDKRRTTMRIDEIEADLKTKQIRQRPDSDYRHPVYKPEPTSESPNTTPFQEATSKRGQFRRRRPSYSSSTTEGAVTKKATYDANKNRFRGRRPTDKTTLSAETTEDSAATTTVKTVTQSRYTRPRLSERFNRRPAEIPDEPEDQDSNYSYNRPKYVSLDDKTEVEQWSTDSFKPYNPNDIKDDQKQATTEHRSSISDDLETDIITARNDYDDILVSVTPASNQLNKKTPDIPPTLEALVEQSKNTNTEAGEMSTFETMLEEVMKTLEEQDRDEYSKNVKKHKGGEIGEIPPERVISDGDKTTTVLEREVTTSTPEAFTSSPASEVRLTNQLI